jgi:ABC-type polysaccharide/polyol phosphate export permease
MKLSKFFVFVGVLFAVSVAVYLTTTPRGKEIPLTGIVTGNDVIVSSQIVGRMIRLTVDEGTQVHKGDLIAGIDRLWDPLRLFYLMFVLGTTSVAMISFMFLMMVRVSDPLVPRAMFGVLNTLLYFPSGAIYPVEGFPVWLRWISYVDPLTYAVHALKALLLKNTGFSGIYSDILILSGFSVVLVSLSVAFFKRQI